MFASKLESAVRDIPGGRAAIIMGFDGIPLESYPGEDGLDIETMGMELSVVLKEVRKASELLAVGDAEEVTLRTDQITAILRIVNQDYFMLLAMSSQGNLGKARYLLRVLAPQFSAELV
jgi:predicted regulator of Ras-like GTPase activity (Roadblock/LC7/MglB family)